MAIEYPKLKHILKESWSELHSLAATVTEDFVITREDRRIQMHGSGRMAYRRRGNRYSFIRQVRTQTQIVRPQKTSNTSAEVFTVFDGEHVYEQQHVDGKKFVYVYPSDHPNVRMTIPSILFFKFLERRGIVETCTEETFNNEPHYVIGLEVLHDTTSREQPSQPALEVFYLYQGTGLITCKRLFNEARREIGRRLYSDFKLNEDTAEDLFLYTKPADVVALPVDD